MKVLEAVKEAIGSCGLSDSDFEAAFDGWEMRAKYCDGAVVAVILQQGAEVHIARCAKTIKNMRSVLRDAAKTTLDLYGHATTTVGRDDDASARFIERLGFKKSGTSEVGNIYRLEKCDWRY